MRYAIFLSIIATLAYNFFFLPPIGTFTISDPQNWVALLAFLLTAVIASQLAERARREALTADRRRRELERLYAFSQQMLATDNVLTLINNVPRNVVEILGGSAAGMYLTERKKVYYSDIKAKGAIEEDELRLVGEGAESITARNPSVQILPLRVGVRAVGALGVLDAEVGRGTLDAVGSLVAIAIERAGAVEKLAQTEANRESERMRSVLLDSVTHEFRTP